MHTRRVEYRGFHRADGLWDIEGTLHDSKPHDFEIQGERRWAAGEPVHHMHLRVTVDNTMVIREIAVAMDAHPHGPCPEAMAPMQRLVGEVLGDRRDEFVLASKCGLSRGTERELNGLLNENTDFGKTVSFQLAANASHNQ